MDLTHINMNLEMDIKMEFYFSIMVMILGMIRKIVIIRS